MMAIPEGYIYVHTARARGVIILTLVIYYTYIGYCYG